jgi:predicted signal transduction protein with EAL and GGDEF domain
LIVYTDRRTELQLERMLGMSVLIEGVETEEQRVLLRLAGCNEMQAFLFARPAPREQIDRLGAGLGQSGFAMCVLSLSATCSLLQAADALAGVQGSPRQ